MRLLLTKEPRLITKKTFEPYAILSHTWSADEDDEVSFEDMVIHKEDQKKDGYAKLLKCCNIASEDGYKYVWIDTCCIDKKSSAELSEAINSMYRWYSEASVCYAYLADVSFDQDAATLERNFGRSRWFRRGWTLQELLAPKKLLFYTKDWTCIGDRERWKGFIAKITTIHEDALSGDPDGLWSYSISQKMSWAWNRTTTREEDVAYSLMGLFNVHMPLLYGEGKEAFIRLQKEIIKDSDDQTIFCWDSSNSDDKDSSDPSGSSYCGLLAPSPREFRHHGVFAPEKSFQTTEPYSMTNAGMRITGPLYQRNEQYRLILRCYNTRRSHTVAAIPLRRLYAGGDQFTRIRGNVYKETDFREFDLTTQTQTIYIRQETPRMETTIKEIGKSISFLIKNNHLPSRRFRVTEVFPSDQWNATNRIISAPNYSRTVSFSNWTWHVSALMKFEQPPISFTAFIGYNGRQDKCWCKLFDLHNSQNLGFYWRNEALPLNSDDTSQDTSELVVGAKGTMWMVRISLKFSQTEERSLAVSPMLVDIAIEELPKNDSTSINETDLVIR